MSVVASLQAVPKGRYKKLCTYAQSKDGRESKVLGQLPRMLQGPDTCRLTLDHIRQKREAVTA